MGADPTAVAQASAQFEIDCQLDYVLDAPCDFIFMVHVAQHAQQRVLDESLQLTPQTPWRLHVDASGNRVLRLHALAGPLSLAYRATVQRDHAARDFVAPEMPIDQLPDDVLPHLLPTRYCESDVLSGAALKLFGALPSGYQRVQAISDWISANIEYRPGSTVATTTSRDVFVQRTGVCRDFAHLGVTFCRALNVPARLVCGYVQFEQPPPDFHAVFEAYIGGQWVLFDPSRMAPIDSLIRIATGRDAKDVAFATIFGPARMTAMRPDVAPRSPIPLAPPPPPAQQPVRQTVGRLLQNSAAPSDSMQT